MKMQRCTLRGEVWVRVAVYHASHVPLLLRTARFRRNIKRTKCK